MEAYRRRGTATQVLVMGVLVSIPWAGCGRWRDAGVPPPAPSRPFETTGAAESLPVGAYYEARLEEGRGREHAQRTPRASIDEEDLAWVSTRQDARIALMVSAETGFDSWGVETAIAEIPEGWHTGSHRHGEEAIYVVGGSGFAVVDGARYDFAPGTVLGIPHGAAHQLYNTGAGAVRYVSATPYPLERFVGIQQLEQLDDAGPTLTAAAAPERSDGYDQEGRRIRMLWHEADARGGTIGPLAWLRARFQAGVDLWAPGDGATPRARGLAARVATGIGHHGGRIFFMRKPGQTDFPNRLVMMSGILIEKPGMHSGQHAHMDAVLYVLQGHGHSVIEGETVAWKRGTSLHVRGPQTRHQHFNTGDEPTYLLRIASGLRPTLQAATADVFPYLWFEAQGPIER